MKEVLEKKVIKSNLLPFEKTYPAYDLDLQMEVGIPTGEWVHIIESDGIILMSEMAFETLKILNE